MRRLFSLWLPRIAGDRELENPRDERVMRDARCGGGARELRRSLQIAVGIHAPRQLIMQPPDEPLDARSRDRQTQLRDTPPEQLRAFVLPLRSVGHARAAGKGRIEPSAK